VSRWKFSNFIMAEVELDGVTYPTVEHAYQAAKSMDPDVRDQIMACEKPGQAKKMGTKVDLRPDWEEVKVGIMDKLLRQKFSPGSKFYDELMETGRDEIVEWNTWHDTFWGKCTCESCGGHGANILGKLLMAIRGGTDFRLFCEKHCLFTNNGRCPRCEKEAEHE
jgi:ribA/ribD-fused uncharacterized protein